MPIIPGVEPTVLLPTQPSETPWPATDWPEGEPPAQIASALTALLDQAFPAAADTAAAEECFGQSLAFVAIHNGRLIAERYGDTAGPDESLISWSMAKSVTQALLGVLVKADRLDIHAAPVLDEWSDPEDPRSAITVDQLLRMASGTEFNEDYVDAETSHCIEMLFGTGNPNMAAYTAALPMVAEPDARFNYASGTSVLLCRILAEIVGSGDDFEAWAKQALFDIIGMKAALTFDEAGTWVGSSFLHATARDFARFGLLYLRDGEWDGEVILPPGWVDYARTIRARNDEGTGYGAHWWIWPPDENVFYAAGYETQRIMVDPANDLVLVRLGKTPIELAPAVDHWLEQIRHLFSDLSDRFLA